MFCACETSSLIIGALEERFSVPPVVAAPVAPPAPPPAVPPPPGAGVGPTPGPPADGTGSTSIASSGPLLTAAGRGGGGASQGGKSRHRGAESHLRAASHCCRGGGEGRDVTEGGDGGLMVSHSYSVHTAANAVQSAQKQ